MQYNLKFIYIFNIIVYNDIMIRKKTIKYNCILFLHFQIYINIKKIKKGTKVLIIYKKINLLDSLLAHIYYPYLFYIHNYHHLTIQKHAFFFLYIFFFLLKYQLLKIK